MTGAWERLKSLLDVSSDPRTCPECGSEDHHGVFEHVKQEHPDSMLAISDLEDRL